MGVCHVQVTFESVKQFWIAQEDNTKNVGWGGGEQRNNTNQTLKIPIFNLWVRKGAIIMNLKILKRDLMEECGKMGEITQWNRSVMKMKKTALLGSKNMT